MNEDGSFAEFAIDGRIYAGKALMDIFDQKARAAYLGRRREDGEQRRAADLMWYMWCGKKSRSSAGTV